MKTSPEFRGARLVLVGVPGSGTMELLEAAALRHGGDPPETLAAGRWETLRADAGVGSTPLELVCLKDAGSYAGVGELLLRSADGVIFVFDVSPHRIGESRRLFDRYRPHLEDDERPFAVQYHRVEREPRFEAARMDAWLGLEGTDIPRASSHSDAPDRPFESLVSALIPGSPEE